MDIIQRMREEWNRRARKDAYFYAAFGRRHQDDGDFLASGAETVAKLQEEFVRLPEASRQSWRALEIGCGPGRLMLPLSRYFSEIHGVDISDEMVGIARENLKDIPHAHVHLTTGSSLQEFPAEHFDFVYSYIVFQHIPEREIVINYLRESRRVLKAGGVLCCQLRGTAPLASEMQRETPTWTGCYFRAEELIAFSREDDFLLVAMSGLDTQYMWTTWMKPRADAGADNSGGFVLKAVTAATNGGNVVPDRGAEAAVSLWIDGLPAWCHLGNLEVSFDAVSTAGCYLSALSPSGACQLNARLPVGVATGRVMVALRIDGESVGGALPIEVVSAPPRQPRVLSVSDGINITSKGRVETGGMKVTIEDVAHPEEVSFTVAGRPAQYLQFERKDPITGTYEFAFHLSHKTRLGNHLLKIAIGDHELPPEAVEVVGLSEDAPAPGHDPQRGREEHHAAAGKAGGAPLDAPVVPQRKLARTLARWFNNKKP